MRKNNQREPQSDLRAKGHNFVASTIASLDRMFQGMKLRFRGQQKKWCSAISTSLISKVYQIYSPFSKIQIQHSCRAAAGTTPLPPPSCRSASALHRQARPAGPQGPTSGPSSKAGPAPPRRGLGAASAVPPPGPGPAVPAGVSVGY
jgi:hypothetical protein